MYTHTKTSSSSLTLSRAMAMLCAFSLPWSPSIFILSLLMMVALFIISLPFQSDWHGLLKIPTAVIALIFFAYIFIRTLTSTAPWMDAQRDLYLYAKLIAIPILISLLTTTEHKKQLVISYCFGVCVLMLPTLIDGFGYASFLEQLSVVQRDPTYKVSFIGAHDLVYWHHHIIHGFHVSILFSVCLLGSLYYKTVRWPLFLMSLLCVIDLVFFVGGRMAFLSLYLIVALVGFLLRHNKKHLIVCLGLLALLFISAYTVPAFKAKFASIQSETSSALAREDLTLSASQRLHYWTLSWHMFKEAPVFGKGSGYFTYFINASQDPMRYAHRAHTHNEYLTQLSLYGLTGFFLLMALIGIALRNARKIDDPWLAHLTTTALVIFCFNALTDGSLFNIWEGATFVILVSIASGNRLLTTNGHEEYQAKFPYGSVS